MADRFDDITNLVGYWSATESTVTLHGGSTVNTVSNVYGSVPAATLADALNEGLIHTAAGVVGAMPAFQYTFNSDQAIKYDFGGLDLSANGYTVALLVSLHTLSTSQHYMWRGSGTATGSPYIRDYGFNSHYRPRGWTSNITLNEGTRTLDTPVTLIMSVGPSGDAVNFYLDNVLDTACPLAVGSNVTDMGMFTVGKDADKAAGMNVAIVCFYDKALNATEVGEVHDLMAHWRDNNEGPAVGPTSGQFGPVTTNKDGEVTTWNWQESSDGTNWGNVGTILTDVTGANSATLTVNSATLAMHNTQVRCQADTGSQQATSDPATLTVLSQTTGTPPAGPPKDGVVFQTKWDDDEGWEFDFSEGADRYIVGPRGFFRAYGHQNDSFPDTAEFKVMDDPVHGNRAMRMRFGDQDETAGDDNGDLVLDLALGNRHRGYKEFYLRYNFRFNRDFRFNDGSNLGFWKWFRASNNAWTPEDGDPIDLPAQSRHENAGSAQTILQVDSSPVWGGRGWAFYTYYNNVATGYQNKTTIRPTERFGGGSLANLDPINHTTEEYHVDFHGAIAPQPANGRFIQDVEQDYHTMEVHFKSATGPDADDGFFQIYYDGVAQIGTDENGYGTAEKPWSHFEAQDAHKWHPDVPIETFTNPCNFANGPGFNNLHIFGNEADVNSQWGIDNLVAGWWVKDLVISTKPIGHDYQVEGYHNSLVEDAQMVGAPIEILTELIYPIDHRQVGYTGQLMAMGFHADNTATFKFFLTRDSGGGEVDLSTEGSNWVIDWGTSSSHGSYNAIYNNSAVLEAQGAGLTLNDTGLLRFEVTSVDGTVSSTVRLEVQP